MHRIVVDVPEATGDKIAFRWTSSQPNPFQSSDSFFLRYEDLDVRGFAPELWYEIFLGLQLRVYAALSGQVELVFPTGVPRPTVDYWLAFHNATNVTISPVAEVAAYSPFSNRPHVHPDSRRAAIFFGGGKDSTLAACLAREIEGPDQVLLVQFIVPLTPGQRRAELLERRQQSLMLQPTARRLGVGAQRIWTDYQANFFPSAYGLRPNLELYTLGSLPVLLSREVEWCSFAVTRHIYAGVRTRTGRLSTPYSRSRPEEIANQSRHFQAVLQSPLTVTNLIFPLNPLQSYQLLAERYPDALQGITPCTMAAVGKRWCYQCGKCWGAVQYSLATGATLHDFDYEFFLRNSKFSERLAEFARTGVETVPGVNAPRQSFMSGERIFDLTCHHIARISAHQLPPRLSAEACATVALAQALYGNRLVPEFDQVPRRVLAMLGKKFANSLEPILSDHFAVTDQKVDWAAQGLQEWDIETNYVPRTSAVAHIRHEVGPARAIRS